jgi:hypothetical protein
VEPLLLHHHLAKNAGTSLQRVLRANFDSEQLFENYVVLPEIDGRRWWRDWYASLDGSRRARLRCVGSHTAQLLLPIVTDRQVIAFTVLRDPVDRVRSLYNHALRQHGRRRAAGEPLDRELLANEILGRGWTLKDIYREVGDRDPDEVPLVFRIFFNGQTRELLANSDSARTLPLTTGAGLEPHRRSVLDLLSERYLVGTQDRFSQSVRLFADRFGWRTVFLPHARAAPDRGGPELDAETRSLARTYNTLDTELHRRYSEELASLPSVSGLDQARWRARRRLARAVRGARKAPRRLRSRVAGAPLASARRAGGASRG